MTDTVSCIYCSESFARNKYSPRQKVCSKPECQHERQIRSMRDWRQKHPDYFKYDESKGQKWLDKQRQRSKMWRQRNPDKVKAYRQTHIDEYRKYMRDYMKRYRDSKKKPDGSASEGPSSPSNPSQLS